MSQVMIKRTGTNFEVSNGTIVLQGPNRSALLAAMDLLESTPANEKAIEARVEKAAKVTQKKAAAKKATEAAKTKTVKAKKSDESLSDRVLAAIGNRVGVSRAQIIEKLGIESDDEGRAVSSTLSRLTKSKVLKSKNGPDGVKVWRKA